MLIYLIQQGKLPFTSSNVVVTCFLPSGECFLGSRLSWVGEYLVVSGLGICVTQCFILYLNDGLRPFTPTLVALSSFSHLFLITWWKLGNSRSTSPLLTAWIGLDQILPHLSVAFDKSVRQIFECNFCASSRVWSASIHSICSQLFSSLSFCTFCTSAVVFTRWKWEYCGSVLKLQALIAKQWVAWVATYLLHVMGSGLSQNATEYYYYYYSISK